MLAQSTFVALAITLSTANAAILNLFSDHNCQTPAGTRNVEDNTCAPTGGFESYIITTAGGSDQSITTYSMNSCAGAQTACNGAGATGVCFEAFDSSGASNAVGSGTACGV